MVDALRWSRPGDGWQFHRDNPGAGQLHWHHPAECRLRDRGHLADAGRVCGDSVRGALLLFLHRLCTGAVGQDGNAPLLEQGCSIRWAVAAALLPVLREHEHVVRQRAHLRHRSRLRHDGARQEGLARRHGRDGGWRHHPAGGAAGGRRARPQGHAHGGPGRVAPQLNESVGRRDADVGGDPGGGLGAVDGAARDPRRQRAARQLHRRALTPLTPREPVLLVPTLIRTI